MQVPTHTYRHENNIRMISIATFEKFTAPKSKAFTGEYAMVKHYLRAYKNFRIK